MLYIEGPFKVIQLEFETHWLTLAGGVEGAGSLQKAPVPFPRGRFETHPSVWLLSESALCLFTAVTVTGSGVGGADNKKKEKSEAKKVKREAAAGFCSWNQLVY